MFTENDVAHFFVIIIFFVFVVFPASLSSSTPMEFCEHNGPSPKKSKVH
jgi:hypothetical protein